MAILMKETKIKTSSLLLTLESGNKILARSIFFYYQRKQELKTKDGRDLITTLTLMTAVTGKLNMPINDFHSRKCLFNSFTWLFFG